MDVRTPAPLPEPEVIDPQEIYNAFREGRTDIVAVVGPTASGKTRYAVGLARAFDRIAGKPVAEIISADSRQVYRGMDIGTGKDLGEYGGVPLHLTDIADAGTKYNIYEYQRDFEAAYGDIISRGGIPILCGGSGLYVEAAICGYSLPAVPENGRLRAELEALPDEELKRRFESLRTPHNVTDYDSRKRLIRAIEIAEYERINPVERSAFLPKNAWCIGTLVSREERNARIDRRLDERLAEGMVEEVRSLLEDRNIAPEDLIYYGLEYKFVTQYVTGVLSYVEMREKLATAIHQFAKRQMTWFRGMERRGVHIHWVRGTSPDPSRG